MIEEVVARSVQGTFDVKAMPLNTSWLPRPLLICPPQLARVQKVGTPLAIAIAFALVILMATAAFAQGQASSPQGTPASQSSAPEPPSQGSADAETTRSVRIGGNVVQASLMYQVAPVYPPLAKSAHVSGTVLLHCIIGTDGTVQELHYVSGPPLLMKSAIDAVSQWRYKPTLINGNAVRVDTTVSVVFTLGGSSTSDASQQLEKKPLDRYKFTDYVNDFAGVIDSEDKSRLDLICKDLDEKKEIQMAVVTIESLDGQPIKDFATQLGNLWRVGHKGTNRGLLILFSVMDRQYRIAVGRGLESVLTDEEADRLGREMVPMLRTGDYGEALLQLAKRIQLEIAPKVE
jgi:TonB family protein